MSAVSSQAVLVFALFGAATISAVDLQRQEARTLVIYTTPALQDFLDTAALPAFTKATGIRAQAVYINAADEYYRVRLSPDRPEADVFLQASPLYLEKGYAQGMFTPFAVNQSAFDLDSHSREVDGKVYWRAFAWSPLVEVYGRRLSTPPDMATGNERLGFADPLLSNNGIYSVLLYENDTVDPAAGPRALERTVVQPTNARANIGGVADGSFDVTLGYEAVASFYQGRGANVTYTVPIFGGHPLTTPVLFAAAIVNHHPHAGAEALVAWLFGSEAQSLLAKPGLRPVIAGVPGPKHALDLGDATSVTFDWSGHWRELESALSRYEVQR